MYKAISQIFRIKENNKILYKTFIKKTIFN